MHVLMVTGEYPPLTGGVGDYTRLLARALIRKGHRVRVAAATGKPIPGRGGPDEPEVLTLPRRWTRGHRRAIARLAKTEQGSWIHVQYQTAAYRMNPGINQAPAAWAAQGLHVAWTYHDLLPPYLFPRAGDALRQRVTLTPGRASHIVVSTNREDADRLALAGIRAEVSPVGSNIPRVTLNPRDKAALRASWRVRPDEPVIGCFGLAGRTKGLQTLVEAARLLKTRGTNLRIVIIGGTVGASDHSNAAFLQSLRNAIRTAGLENRVHWTGALSDREASRSISACDLMVQPYTEGASTRHGSLMACLDHGCATITSTPLSDGWLDPGVPTVPPLDFMALAARIACLAASPEKRAVAAAAARVSAADRSWERIADLHAALYAAAV